MYKFIIKPGKGNVYGGVGERRMRNFPTVQILSGTEGGKGKSSWHKQSYHVIIGLAIDYLSYFGSL